MHELTLGALHGEASKGIPAGAKGVALSDYLRVRVGHHEAQA